MGEDKVLKLCMAGYLTKVHSHQGNLVQAEIIYKRAFPGFETA